MTLKYRITHDDLAAFFRFHYRRRPSNKITTVASVVFMWAFLLGIAVFLAPDPAKRKVGVTVAVIISSVVTIFLVPLSEAVRLWAVKRAFKEGDTLSLGTHQIDLGDSHLLVRSEFFESRFPVSAIRQIEEIRGYVFIYLTSNTAVVVPTDTVLTGEPARFATRLKEMWHESSQQTNYERSA